MTTHQCPHPVWHRGNPEILWGGSRITAPRPVLWVAELPSRGALAVVTVFDEDTPPSETNGFVYRERGGFTAVRVSDRGRFVRFLGCYPEGEALVFNAANDTEYVFDADSLAVLTTRYYR